jgi:aspartyl-tRNA(Asn)/glutamyl-tRNA(Gln) amidotransferase subunit B
MDAPAKKSKLIKGATGDWEVVIGLEVHAQVTSEAKLFSGASTEFGGEPNSHVSLVDAAMPGMLPVINEECVRQAVRTGLGLKAKINLKSVFDRKNYFYPDLPQGYQISQYKSPIVGEGEVVVDMPDGETVRVGIERLHLEQDAGKSLHDQNPSMSLVDLNRAGVALMEIVSKPDLRSADEAKAYVAKLRAILRYLGTCDGDMEKGSLRADVNVSVRKPGEQKYNTRCEIKNVNSIRFIGQAVEHEAWRQIGIIEDGGTIEQETRLFDPDKGETRSMRSKEEAHDYRYFPDPDLLPLELAQAEVDELKAHLPELPDEKKSRFMRDHALSAYDADVLVAERERAEYYEEIVKGGAEPKAAANWLINEYLGRLNRPSEQRHGTPTVNSTAAT